VLSRCFACFAPTILRRFLLPGKWVKECWFVDLCCRNHHRRWDRGIPELGGEWPRWIAADWGVLPWLSIAWLWATVGAHAGGSQPVFPAAAPSGVAPAPPGHDEQLPPPPCQEQHCSKRHHGGQVARVLVWGLSRFVISPSPA